MCGDCCRGYGGTYVTDRDIQAIAAYIGEDPERFKTRYCQLSGSRYVLAQSENGYCVFWDRLCQIHPVKPRMCRHWPYIAAILEDVANWRIMARDCPGIRTDFPDDVITRSVAREIDARRKAAEEHHIADDEADNGE
jgi:Fe-S-cluster containining protein